MPRTSWGDRRKPLRTFGLATAGPAALAGVPPRPRACRVGLADRPGTAKSSALHFGCPRRSGTGQVCCSQKPPLRFAGKPEADGPAHRAAYDAETTASRYEFLYTRPMSTRFARRFVLAAMPRRACALTDSAAMAATEQQQFAERTPESGVPVHASRPFALVATKRARTIPLFLRCARANPGPRTRRCERTQRPPRRKGSHVGFHLPAHVRTHGSVWNRGTNPTAVSTARLKSQLCTNELGMRPAGELFRPRLVPGTGPDR
jgi:hypothetical protein